MHVLDMFSVFALDLNTPSFSLLKQKDWVVKKLRSMRLVEICFLALFAIILLLSIIFSIILHNSNVSLILLLTEFPIIAVVAICGSLSIREEEEET